MFELLYKLLRCSTFHMGGFNIPVIHSVMYVNAPWICHGDQHQHLP